MPAIRARYLVARGRFRPAGRRVRVFHLHTFETHKPRRIRQAKENSEQEEHG
jgi:hypothetical protein